MDDRDHGVTLTIRENGERGAEILGAALSCLPPLG